MTHYYSLGKIPHKRHTVFRKPSGELYAEQLVSTKGFSDNYSLAYHCYPPTNVRRVGKPFSVAPEPGIEKNMQHRNFLAFNIQPEKDFLKSRKIVLYNNDTNISLAAPQDSMKDYYYKNSQADEYIFIQYFLKLFSEKAPNPLVRVILRPFSRQLSGNRQTGELYKRHYEQIMD